MRTLASYHIVFLTCVLTTSAASMQHEVREVHYQMGTFLEFTLWHSEPEIAKRLIRESVQEVHRLEEVLSNYDPDSPVSRFNQNAGKGKTSIPAELSELLTIARCFSVKTAGYFDVTVGPLVELWRNSLSKGLVPDRDALAIAQTQVGYEKLKLYGGSEAELLVPGMKIDLGGIGKGYAVDRVADRLKAAGVTSALINFGGSSIYAIGAPPEEPGWEIGVQGPNGNLRGGLHLNNLALSTSGSMGRFWTIRDKKYGHLINPKSGIPVSEPRMATVITSTATAAEALTKPLVLLGKDGLWTIGRLHGTEAVVISEKGRLFFSKSFRSKTRWREVPRA